VYCFTLHNTCSGFRSQSRPFTSFALIACAICLIAARRKPCRAHFLQIARSNRRAFSSDDRIGSSTSSPLRTSPASCTALATPSLRNPRPRWTLIVLSVIPASWRSAYLAFRSDKPYHLAFARSERCDFIWLSGRFDGIRSRQSCKILPPDQWPYSTHGRHQHRVVAHFWRDLSFPRSRTTPAENSDHNG